MNRDIGYDLRWRIAFCIFDLRWLLSGTGNQLVTKIFLNRSASPVASIGGSYAVPLRYQITGWLLSSCSIRYVCTTNEREGRIWSSNTQVSCPITIIWFSFKISALKYVMSFLEKPHFTASPPLAWQAWVLLKVLTAWPSWRYCEQTDISNLPTY